MKKLFLISSLLLCSLSIFSYSGTCGDPNVNGGKNVKWTLSNGTLTISGSGAMLDYKGGATSTSEMFGWTNYRSEINKVVIKSGVTNVGTSAFVDCSKLSSVTLASSVTKIGSDAFNACGSLKNIVLPNALTTIGDRSFQATNIKKITFPSTIQDIGMMAFLNAGLDTVICEAITPPSLGLYAFGYSTMDILYVHNVETYKNDASWRNKFKEIQKIDGSSYEEEEEELGGTCGTNVKWTYKGGVLTISGDGAMNDFYNYWGEAPWHEYVKDITSIEIEEGITHIGDRAFCGCNNNAFTSITLPSTLIAIGMSAFGSCRNLSEVTCKALTPPSIGSGAFDATGDSKRLYVYNPTIYVDSEWENYFTIKQIGATNESSYTVDVKCNPEHGTVSGGGTYEEGATIKISAYSNIGYKFVRWSDENTDNPRILTVTADLTLTAEFAKINIPTYTVMLTCNPEHGTVSGSGVYQVGETATLTATPKYGYKFVRWSDENTDNPRILTVTADLTLTAEFAIIEDDDVIDSGICGENLTWTLTYNGVLTISGTGDMKDYSQWNGKKDIIKNVIVMYGVTSIGEAAFSYCTSLTSITIPNSVTSIGGWAFQGCSSLTSVIIPNSITSIGEYAFDGCSSLTSVIIPNSITSIGEYAFSYCTSLTSVIIPNSVTSIGWGAFKDCSSLTSVIIPNSVTSIGGWAFQGCSSLTSITIPNSVTSIRGDAFSGTGIYNNESNWENDVLYISNCLIEAKTKISGSYTIKDNTRLLAESAFYGCTSLTSVTIPNSVTSIGYRAFEDCSSLTSITIPNSVTSIVGEAFKGCSSLTSITIPNSITEINGGIFAGCSSLTSITIPNSVTSIGYSVFEGCSSLTSITIPNSVTSIRGDAFSGCSSLTSITIPDGVTSIEYDAFYGCSSLLSVTIGNGVTSIGNAAFSGCTSLLSVTIGNGVTSIGTAAFSGCTSLTTIICKAIEVPTLGGYVFDDKPHTEATLYVTAESLEDYKAAYQWNSFGNILPIDNITYSITLTCNPEHGTVSGDGVYQVGETATLTATPKDGYEFVRWSDGSTANPRTLTVTADLTLTAEFAKINIPTYTVTLTCNPEHGTVSGDGVYQVGETATLTATPKDGYEFVRWSDGNTANPRTLTITNNLTLTAEFAEIDDNEVIDSGKCGKNLTWTLTYNGVLTISGTGDMYNYDYTNNLAPWNSVSNNIKNIVLPEGLTSIGEWAFYLCASVTSISIPEGVSSIGVRAFCNCSSLTSISIPNSVTSVGERAFYSCYNLASVTLSTNLSKIDKYLFGQCRTLAAITIPNNVTTIENGAFSGCSSLDSVSIEATTPPVLSGSSTFSSSPTCYIPCGTLAAYQSSSWAEQVGGFVEQCDDNDNNQSLVSVTDATLSDWDKLPMEYLFETKCVEGADWDALKSVKVYADLTYINLVVEWDTEIVTDLSYVPFHVYLNVDNDAPTGGFGGLWIKPNIDLLLEGYFYLDGNPCAYQPDVAFYAGSPLANEWVWDWTTIEALAASQLITKGVMEIQIEYGKLPVKLENTFTVGFDIQQSWNSVGVLPNAAADEAGNMILAEKMLVRINNVNAPTSIENTHSPSSITNTHKLLHNGQLIILHDGKTYTVMGAEIQ